MIKTFTTVFEKTALPRGKKEHWDRKSSRVQAGLSKLPFWQTEIP